MKTFGKIGASLVAGAVFTLALATPPPTASVLLSKAEQQAAQQDKNVLVIFHASWCGWCKKLDAFMDKPEYEKLFAKNYVIVHLDVLESKDKKDLENAGGQEELATLGGDKGGIPFYAVLSPAGQELISSNLTDKSGSNIGYPAEPKEIEHFMAILKKTAKHMKPAEFSSVKTYLVVNAPKPAH